MTRDDIIRMAREAGFDPHDMSDDFTCNLTDIEHFAALAEAHGAAAEREACARACDKLGDEFADANAADCAEAIRARSQ